MFEDEGLQNLNEKYTEQILIKANDSFLKKNTLSTQQ